MTETDIQARIRIELSKHRIYVVRNQSGTFYTKYGGMVKIGVKGMPDLLAIRPDKPAVFLEVKKPGGKETQEQKAFKVAMNEYWNIEVYTVYSVQDALYACGIKEGI